MDAMRALVTTHDVRPEQIRAIRLRAGSNILNPLRYGVAKSELEAKFSPPFMLSAIALRRRAGIREFSDEFVLSAPVQQMMARVQTVLDPEIEAKGFEKIRSTVEVDLADGRTLVQPADERYRGGPERPFTRDELHEKFTDCAGLVLPPPAMTRVLELVESITAVADITEVVHAAMPAAAAAPSR
jgi:2-methylcitrate dehydratase PrpD